MTTASRSAWSRREISWRCSTGRDRRLIDDPVLVEDWHPVARIEDLHGGGPIGARLLGEDIVVWRSGNRFHAWRDLCVHRGTRLSLGHVVGGDRLECPYHGWKYGEDGRCVLMPAHPEQAPPAKACVTVYRARSDYGVVWVTLGSGAKDLPRFELLDDPGHQVLKAGPYRVRASAPRVVENFLVVFRDLRSRAVAQDALVHEREMADVEEVLDHPGRARDRRSRNTTRSSAQTACW